MAIILAVANMLQIKSPQIYPFPFILRLMIQILNYPTVILQGAVYPHCSHTETNSLSVFVFRRLRHTIDCLLGSQWCGPNMIYSHAHCINYLYS